ncbi:MAG: O-antigen ligase family protein, partial [Phycisphaerae bacterium]
MTAENARTRQPMQGNTSLGAPEPSRAENILLVILLCMTLLRVLIQETHTLEVPALTAQMGLPTGPTPVITIGINAVILAAAVMLVFIRILRVGPSYRWTGAEIGIALVAAGGVISCVQAGRPRTAITGVVDFGGLLLFFVVVRQCLQRPWQMRLALCVVLAGGAVVAVKCYLQVYDEFPATQKHYEENIATRLRESLAPRERGRLHDFEQRLKSRSATGYFAHSNVTATYLALIVMTGLAVAAQRRRHTPLGAAAMVAPIGVSLLAAGALFLTQSKGAMAAALGGLVLWMLWRFGKKRLRSRPATSLVVFWLVGGSLALGVIGYGLSTGGLPSRSMLFRWMYWRGATAMVADIGPWGVGANQFGAHFPRYKPVECPEEVQSPHSWIVRAGAEWGLLGLAGLV